MPDEFYYGVYFRLASGSGEAKGSKEGKGLHLGLLDLGKVSKSAPRVKLWDGMRGHGG